MGNVSRVLCFAVMLLACAAVFAGEARAGVARPYVASRFALELGGVPCGFLNSVEGGGAYGEVVEETTSTYYRKKHLGGVRYEPIVLQCGVDMTGPLLPWVSDMLAGKITRKDGRIVAVDYNGNASEVLDFTNAILGEVRFPACDAAAKELGYLTLTLVPEATRRRKLSGKYSMSMASQQQKKWLPSNFRVEVDGLPTTRVSKVSEVVAKVVTEIGPAHEERGGGGVEFGNVTLSLSQADADPWYAWLEQFVIQGKNSDAQEKTVTITYLSPNLQTELAKLRLFNAGLVRFGPEKAEANSEQAKRAIAELYYERAEADFSGKPGRDVPAQ